jgi:muramidase (phage lysozyme)
MDRSVPAGAALLLAFISKTETGRDRPQCYEVIFGHNQDKLPKKITQMTLDEVEAAQPSWTKRFGSSAAGAYQFMRNTLDAPKTLRDIEGEMGLTGKEKFTPAMQDRMAYHLLKRRGYLDFVAGEITAVEFGKRLAMEWASFPVLAATKGSSRQIKRGQSYYAGDGVNKALTTPEAVEAVLKKVLAVAQEPEPIDVPAVPMPAPAPVTAARPGWLGIAGIAAMALLVFAWQWLSGKGGDAVATVLPNGAPIPFDRPMQFTSGAAGGIFAGIGLQILLAFVEPLAAAAATAGVGWVVYLWQRLLKTEFDKKSAESLHAALERGLLAAIDALGSRAGKASLLSFAADYAQQWNGGTVKRFGLTHEGLQQLALPHLAALKRDDAS